MVHVREIVASSILVPQKVGSLSGVYDFTLNPYAGCAFACSYCYVPKFPNGRHAVQDWGKWVEVKTNAPELIRKERTSVFGSRIFFSSATDPYQYLELKYRLSRRCLQELLKYKPQRITLHTRSHLILQDLELIKAFNGVAKVGVSITTDDDSIRRQFEPNAPSIPRRLQLIRRLREAGIDVYVSMSPLLPCDPERFVELVSQYASSIWVGPMNYPEINNRPYLLEKYRDFFEPTAYSKTIHTLISLFKNSRAGQSLRVRETSMHRKAPSSVALQIVRARSHSRQTDTQLKLL
jgi:DNA repair photolyase